MIAPKLHTLLIACLLTATSLFSQDLIERTQQGLSNTSTLRAAPNPLADLVQSARNSRSGFTEVELFDVGVQDQSKFARFVNDGVLLELKKSALTDFWKSKLPAVNLKIPVNEVAAIELDLVRVDIFTDDFTLITDDGRTIDGIKNQGIFYRGIVKGDVSSLASVSVFEDNVRIMIGDDDGNYIVGEMEELGEHILYNDQRMVEANPFSCGTNDNQIPSKGLRKIPTNNSRSRSSMTNCIPIYVECDFRTFQDIGSEVLVGNYVASLVNESATLYAAESIDISLSQVKVWTSTDPYAGMNDAGDILEAFGENIKDNYNGRLAHWISTRNLGGGVAWVDVLCDTYFTFMANFGDGNKLHHAGPYAVSAGLGTSITSFPTYSWEVGVFTHEMGHNLGSNHTQACVWNNNNTAIDGCVPSESNNGNSCSRPSPNCPTDKGTIMSYCHTLNNCGVLFSNGFGEQPGDLIRSYYNNASCVLSCVAPTCSDGIQNGDETGVDCGGSSCAICPCNLDGVQNGDETGIDCGGSSCAACPCYESPLTLDITFDDWPEESSWTLKNAGGTILHQGGTYAAQADGSSLSINNLTLANASGYTFTFDDSFGDGICCSNGNGSFSLKDNAGTTIFSGGAFGASTETSFCVDDATAGNDCPTNKVINTSISSGTESVAATITTAGTVNITGTVTFEAGSSVTLNPGFHAQSSSTFLARITACSPLTDGAETELAFKVDTDINQSEDIRISNDLSLAVFPNPTKNTTNIQYHLEASSEVSLSIYDMNGQEVNRLITKQYKDKGIHQMEVNANVFGAGIFYIVLVSGDAAISEKLIVIQ